MNQQFMLVTEIRQVLMPIDILADALLVGGRAFNSNKGEFLTLI